MNKAAILILTVGILCVAGCENKTTVVNPRNGAPQVVENSPQLVAKSRPPISDIPVPVGFKLDMEHSRDMTAGSARWIDHTYKGKADRYAVREFYRRQMPVTNWSLVNMRTVNSEIILEFEKQTERCTITITKGSWLHPVYVHVHSVTAGRVVSKK